MVRPNLHQALKRLRHRDYDRWFWVDAICINQNDNAEKSHQLPRMLDIYRNAIEVCIWLGEFEDAEEVGIHPFDFIPDIVDLRHLERIVSPSGDDARTLQCWRSFAALLQRTWFRRRWVIQEITASSRAFVQYGDKSRNWIDFSDAIELFIAKLDAIRASFARGSRHEDLASFRHLESAGAAAIVSTVNNLIRRTNSGVILDRLFSIERLVMQFKHFDATDPRDTVYALLSLASDGHMSVSSNGTSTIPACLIPDYSKTTVQVYTDFVKHCVLSTRSLDVICRSWALDLPKAGQMVDSSFQQSSSRLPTWIRTVGHSPFDLRARETGRLDGDSLVGEPGHRIYNASRGRAAQASFYLSEDGTSPDGPKISTLSAKGIVLSVVSKVSSRVVGGTISDDCLSMAGWDEGNDFNRLSDRVWRTLVADRDAGGRHTPFWFRRACAYCLSKATPDGDLNTSSLLTDKSLPDTVISYLQRVQAVVWGRKFFECQGAADGGASLFGLGPKAMREHDFVCILFGCSVPVVLREKTSLSGRYYELIGECYAHGLMDGEALAGQEDDYINQHAVEFIIR